MVVPFTGIAAQALGSGALSAGGGGLLAGLGGFLGSQGGQGLLGGLLGGGFGGLFGGRKKTGFGKALNRSLFAKRASQKAAVENFEEFGGRFLDAFRSQSPVFGALESRVLGDLNDEGRTSRLEQAFQSRLMQQQSALGLGRSPTSALRTSFAGLQFSEQQRNAAFDRAMGFQQGLAQPLTTGFFNTGLLNIDGSVGFQQQAFSTGQSAAQNQSILSGIQEGFNAGIGFSGRAQTQSFRDRLLNLFEG